MRIHRVLLVLPAAVLLAQSPPPAPRPVAPAKPAIQPVRVALNLTDQQVQQLLQLRREQQEALRPIREQMKEKQQTLQAALKSGGSDPTTVGQLTLDMRTLREQVRKINEDYHNRAVALLDSTQRERLTQLQRALRLRPAVDAATTLNLLLPPAPQPQDTSPTR